MRDVNLYCKHICMQRNFGLGIAFFGKTLRWQMFAYEYIYTRNVFAPSCGIKILSKFMLSSRRDTRENQIGAS